MTNICIMVSEERKEISGKIDKIVIIPLLVRIYLEQEILREITSKSKIIRQ